MIVQSSRYGDFGLSKVHSQLYCGEVFSVLAELEILLDEAARVGINGKTEYKDAKQFFERETSFITRTYFLPLGSDCGKVEKEGRAKIDALNRAVKAVGGTPSTGLPPAEVSTVDKVLGAAKWVGIAAAIAGAIYLVGPIIRAGTKRVARKIEA